MSSMLKKAGGLSFKPKAGRRPGASQPKATTASASASTTRAPTTEVQPHAPTSTASKQSPPPEPQPTDTTASRPIEQQRDPIENLPSPPQSQIQLPSKPRIPSQPTVRPSNPPHGAEAAASPATPPLSQPNRDQDRITKATDRPIHVPEVSRSNVQPKPSIEKENASSGRSAEPRPPPALRDTAHPTTNVLTPEPSTSTPAPEAPMPNISLPSPSPAPISDTITAIPPTDDDLGATTPAPATASKKRAPRKRAPAGEQQENANTAPRKRPRKKALTTSADGQSAAAVVRNTLAGRRRRSPTPEDAETRTVDHGTMKMGELTKDLGIGKKFKHHDVIEERAREARQRYRMKKLEKEKRKLGLVSTEYEESASRADTPAEGNGTSQGASEVSAALSREGQGLGYEVIDGQIVINQQSLVVDRHNQDISMLETVEEDDFTNLVTSNSYMRRQMGPNYWTEEETERFFHYLRIFGTDFETISHMFPTKNRRAVKLKFNREERLRPNLINQAVMVRGEKQHSIDLEEYKAVRPEWQPKDKIDEEHAQIKAEQDKEIERLKQERREAGLMDDDEDGGAAPGRDKDEEQGTEVGEDGEEDAQNGGEGEGEGEAEEMETIVEDMAQGEAVAA
ncbi:hypothetical protein F5Y15DRAFT_144551 [Xylariaceae sp. FL0016]|nr:hypothetical protein F5Y15DRAFT_144551 [Xylariaceae sp. FL0016]